MPTLNYDPQTLQRFANERFGCEFVQCVGCGNVRRIDVRQRVAFCNECREIGTMKQTKITIMVDDEREMIREMQKVTQSGEKYGNLCIGVLLEYWGGK